MTKGLTFNLTGIVYKKFPKTLNSKGIDMIVLQVHANNETNVYYVNFFGHLAKLVDLYVSDHEEIRINGYISTKSNTKNGGTGEMCYFFNALSFENSKLEKSLDNDNEDDIVEFSWKS